MIIILRRCFFSYLENYKHLKKILVLVLFTVVFRISAQEDQVITTAVPFLTIAADARAAGMGDMGVATSVDAFSQQWNPAKYAFATNKIGIGIGYTPYLESIITDISLLSTCFYTKINSRSAFAVDLRYFTLGEIELRQTAGETGRKIKPNELAISGSYSLKLSDHFSMAVAGRYISSNLKFQDAVGSDVQAANTFAVDIASFYQSSEIAYNNFNGRWRAGFNITNLGNKITYDNGGQENFIPTNLKLGVGFDFIIDKDNLIALISEFNKLLVPTPQDFNNDGAINIDDNDEYQKISFFEGVFKSFGDGEELKEITWALGVEYIYRDSFMLRTGYFNENKEKGSRKIFTLGAGFKFNAIQIDFSYLFSSSKVRNPLENTLRFSLAFNLGKDFLGDY